MQPTKIGKISGAAVNIGAIAVVFCLIVIGLSHFVRPTADGDIGFAATVTSNLQRKVCELRVQVAKLQEKASQR